MKREIDQYNNRSLTNMTTCFRVVARVRKEPKTRRVIQLTALVSLLLLAVQIQAQIQTNVPALKDVYANDFKIGCLLSYRHVGFATDPPVPGQSAVVDTNGGYLIQFHMNSMSPGNNMKAQYTIDIAGSAAAYAAAPTMPEKDSIDVHPIIQFIPDMIAQLNWAQRQGFTFRGHTLVWHSQVPAAFFRTGYQAAGTRLTKAQMTLRMENYIKEIIRLLHEGWPGMVSAMDVVNEAVNDAGSFRTSGNEWYTTFGDTTYVMKAFEFSRTYATLYGEYQMKLYYNDYNTHMAAKADGIVRLCGPIFQAGYLDGIGMQEHDNNSTPTAASWIATYNKFSPICSEMAVTEFDVATGSSNPSAAVLAIQANQYGQLFKCFVERSAYSGRGKIISVSKDGLNDTYTFQTGQSSSLWTGSDQCKPSFYAVARVGSYYNLLDSLIGYSDTLQQNNYTSDSWQRFAASLSSGRTSRDQNYSNLVPADSNLQAAAESLQAAINGLVQEPNGVGDEGNLPGAFSLSQNYPNPFNPSTTIEFALPRQEHVRITLANLLGQRIREVVNQNYEAGYHNVRLDFSHLPAGVYFYTFSAGSFTATRKLQFLK